VKLKVLPSHNILNVVEIQPGVEKVKQRGSVGPNLLALALAFSF